MRAARPLTITAHGASGLVTLPQSSPLMKLPRRPKKMPPGDHGATAVREIEELDRLAAAVEPHRDQHAAQAAVERHPALPHGEDAERIREQLLVRVDEHVADAAADDRAERGVEHDVVDVDRLDLAPRLGRAHAQAKPDEQERGEVHDPVPAHLERAERECDGIEFGIVEHEPLRTSRIVVVDDALVYARRMADCSLSVARR